MQMADHGQRGCLQKVINLISKTADPVHPGCSLYIPTPVSLSHWTV